VIHGFAAPGFEEVRREFERNFAERDDPRELPLRNALYRCLDSRQGP
jgi:hypothetical protein